MIKNKINSLDKLSYTEVLKLEGLIFDKLNTKVFFKDIVKNVNNYNNFVNEELFNSRTGCGKWVENGFYYGYLDDYANDLINRINLEVFSNILLEKGFEFLSMILKDIDSQFKVNTLSIDKDVLEVSGLESLINYPKDWRNVKTLKSLVNRIPYNIDDDFKSALGEYKTIEAD